MKKTDLKKFILFLFFTSLTAALYAQTKQVQGVVKDVSDGKTTVPVVNSYFSRFTH